MPCIIILGIGEETRSRILDLISRSEAPDSIVVGHEISAAVREHLPHRYSLAFVGRPLFLGHAALSALIASQAITVPAREIVPIRFPELDLKDLVLQMPRLHEYDIELEPRDPLPKPPKCISATRARQSLATNLFKGSYVRSPGRSHV